MPRIRCNAHIEGDAFCDLPSDHGGAHQTSYFSPHAPSAPETKKTCPHCVLQAKQLADGTFVSVHQQECPARERTLEEVVPNPVRRAEFLESANAALRGRMFRQQLEERQAWDRYAAAALIARDEASDELSDLVGVAMEEADAMLAARQKRFNLHEPIPEPESLAQRVERAIHLLRKMTTMGDSGKRALDVIAILQGAAHA